MQAVVETPAPSTNVRLSVCRAEDVPPGQMRGFIIDGLEILIIHGPKDTFYALSNECTHGEAPLDLGELLLDKREVQCGVHEGRFNIVTGEATAKPCDEPLPVYGVEIVDGDVVVTV